MNTGTYVIAKDVRTGVVVWSKRISTGTVGPSDGFKSPNLDTNAKLSWLDAKLLWTVDFRNRTVSTIQVGAPIGNERKIPTESTTAGEYYIANTDSILYWSGDADFKCWVILHLDRKIQNKTYISDIIRDVCVMCRIPEEKLDFSGLTSDNIVTGYMIENPTEARGVLEELADAFQFDVIESDYKLKFISRGKPVVATISQADLGVVDTDFGGENEYFIETRMQEVDIPSRVVVEYVDPKEDYENGNASYARPMKPVNVMSSQDRLDVTLNMAMTQLQAKTLAKRILYAAWGERTSREYMVGPDFLRFDPSDVIRINFEDGTSTIERLTDVEVGADYSIKWNSVSQIAANYILTTTVGEPGGVVKEPYVPVPSARPAIFDVPFLYDVDVANNPTMYEFYWASKALGDGFKGGVLSSRVYGSDKSVNEGFTNSEAVWGYVNGDLPTPPSGLAEVTDTETVLELVPAYDWNENEVRYTWETIEDDDWPSTDNMIIINNEVILFKNAEVQGNGHILISHLIRGYRGTGDNAFRHKSWTEQTSFPEWVIVEQGAINDADHPIAEINQNHYYTVATGNMIPSWISTFGHTTTGATRKPFQVGGVTRTNPGNSITVTWNRSTRYGGELKAGTDVVPLNEAFEKYEIYFLNAPYDVDTWDPEKDSMYWHHASLTDVSSITVNDTTLTAAGKTNKSDIHVVIYQVSDQVGRGFPRYVYLPYSMFGL